MRAGIGTETRVSELRPGFRASLATLTGYEPSVRCGFWGVEADYDSARSRPLVVAPNFVADLTTLDLPIRIGVALPIGFASCAVALVLGLGARGSLRRRPMRRQFTVMLPVMLV